MKTLEQAYNERTTLYQALQAEVHSVLIDYCNRRGFLLVGRAKNIESLRDKLETGRYVTLSDVDDALAFSIVIDTLGQEAEVRRFLRSAFNVVSMKSGGTIRDERVFDFDSTRVYCRLIDEAKLKSGIDQITFEVQIRTLLQHAWSKITHPFVYKARTYDPRAGRLAAELMAQLEVSDRSFSRFKTTAKTVKSVGRRDMIASSALTEMIDALVSDGVIPSELRPANGRRLGENIFSSIRDRRNGIERASGVIRAFMIGQVGIFPRSVSLFQLAIVALLDAGLLDQGTATRPKRYYVSDELLSLFPQVRGIRHRVTID